MRDHGDITDEELVARHARGDAAAFGLLQYRHQGRLLGRALLKLPREQAEDTVQEVFIALHTAACDGTRIVGVKAWTNGVLHNKMVDFWRGSQGRELQAARRGKQVQDGTFDLPAPATEDITADWALFEGVLAALSDAHRRIVQLAYIQGWSAAEVGDATGASPDNVYQIVKRFKAAVRRALEDNR